MDEPPLPDRPDRIVGRYALYGKLAAGGMATVHFGRLLGPAGFSRTVAIKRLHPQFAKDPEFVAMFLDEARLAARIQHPNVVATVDVVARDDELFLVMDYVRGESFSRLLRASRRDGIEVPVGIIASVVSGMLDGLHAAHEAKDEFGRPLSVVHRDVSPQNVLVGVDGVPRVLDFGVAKAAARVQVTRDGQMKGKLSYMSPEQLQHRGVDRRTDVFAAGIVLWEALTGRRLFDAEEPSEVLRMIVSEEIPPPSAVLPSITRGMDAAVMKSLARNPDDRYETARAFGVALEEASPLASSRVVGQWVERVAGATLLRRERALAHIESASTVSDVTLTSDSHSGFLKTLDGLSPPPSAPPSDWDDGPTSVYEPPLPSSPTASHRVETSVQVPRPQMARAAGDLEAEPAPGAAGTAEFAPVPEAAPPVVATQAREAAPPVEPAQTIESAPLVAAAPVPESTPLVAAAPVPEPALLVVAASVPESAPLVAAAPVPEATLRLDAVADASAEPGAPPKTIATGETASPAPSVRAPALERKSNPPPKPAWALRSSRPPRPRTRSPESDFPPVARDSTAPALGSAAATSQFEDESSDPHLTTRSAHAVLLGSAGPPLSQNVPLATELGLAPPPPEPGAAAPPAEPEAETPLLPQPDLAPPSGERAVAKGAAATFDDSNETTTVYDGTRRAAEADSGAPAAASNGETEKTESFDDDAEVTTVYPDSRRQAEAVPTVIIADPVPTSPRSTPPEPDASYRARLDTLKIDRRPVSTLPPKEPIAFEPTDPAMFRMRSPPRVVYDWFWADPRERAFRVGAVLAITAFVGVFLVTAHRAKKQRIEAEAAPAVALVPEPAEPAEVPIAEPAAAPSAPPAASATAENVPEEPSSEPSEPPASSERHKHHAKARIVAAAATVPPAAPSPEPLPTEIPVAEPPPAPVTKPPPPPEPDLEDPYKPIDNPYSHLRAGGVSKNVAADPENAHGVSPSRSAVDCRRPYSVDENGIRHPRPECMQ